MRIGERTMDSSNKVTERKSGLAIAGFIIALLALMGSWVPILNNVSFFFAIISLVFGVFGFIAIKKGKRIGQGLAIATIILSILSIVVVIATQSFYGKVINDAGNTVNKATNDANGTNTQQLLKTNVDVTFGNFTAKTENYIESTELPVTVKNKAAEKANYTIKIEAVDTKGTRLADDTLYINSLGANQSVSETAFNYVESNKVESLKTATFKVYEVSKQ